MTENSDNPLLPLVQAAVQATVAELKPLLVSDRWLDDAALALYCPGLRMRTLVRYAKRGDIKLGKAGDSPCVRMSELDRWLERRQERRAVANDVDSDDASFAAASRKLRRTR